MGRYWFIGILLLLAGCAAETGTVKVGAVLPLSGSFAFVGGEQQNAIQMAVEEAGGLEVIYEDSAGENPKALAAFNKLTNIDNAPIVITSTSWISNALYGASADAQAFQVILASSGFQRTRADDKAIRFTADVKDEAAFVVDFLDGFDSVALVHLNNDFGKGWADALRKELGSKLVAVETYDPTDADMSTQLTKIKAKNPDVLFLASSGKDGALVAKKAKELGITAQLVSQRPIETQELLKQGDAAEGLIYSFPAHSLDHPFLKKYEERHGRPPSIFTIEAYDAALLLAEAVKECKDDTTCLEQAFVSHQYDGALGHVEFDDKGDAHYPFVLKQVKDGKFVLYAP